MSTFKQVLAIGTVGAVSLMGAGVASAATNAGPTTPSHTFAAHVVTKKVAFKATYQGTLKLVWGAQTASASIVTSHGTGTYMARGKLTGHGSGADTSSTTAFAGAGVMSGAGSTIRLSVKTTQSSVSTDATASGVQSPPANVTVVGTATVTGGTGKWKGATGTLKFQGSFQVTNATTGTSETDAFSATLTGTLKVKR